MGFVLWGAGVWEIHTAGHHFRNSCAAIAAFCKIKAIFIQFQLNTIVICWSNLLNGQLQGITKQKVNNSNNSRNKTYTTTDLGFSFSTDMSGKRETDWELNSTQQSCKDPAVDRRALASQ